MTIPPPPRNLLVSYHYYAKYNLARFRHCRVIGDSGAFSAASQGVTITTKELAAWAVQWRDVLTWNASLDVIGDPEGTRRNWHELVDVYGVDGVPTIHYGSDPALMDYYAERGVDFMGLGGMVGKPVPKQLRWLLSCFRHARDHHPQMRFHGWGVTADRLMQLPFYSVDSSGWSSSYRYGRLGLRDPTTGKNVTVLLDGRGSYSPEIVSVLQQYGVTPSQVATSGPHNRNLLVKLSALSASVGEQQFRKLHRRNPISTPVWGITRPATGPHRHLAVADGVAGGGSGHVVNTLVELNEPAAPHNHIAVNPNEPEVAALMQLTNGEPGPHHHLAVTQGWQQSTRSWEPDAQLKQLDDVVVSDMSKPPHHHLVLSNGAGHNQVLSELNPGPHMHLVEGAPEHLGIVADLQSN